MDQKVEELVKECKKLQHEISLLTPIILFLSPSFSAENMAVPTISSAERLKIRDKLERSGSPARIKMEYMMDIKELEKKLANLAELLEEEEFEIGKFRSQLSEDHFHWLVSHKKEIKQHLRGFELR
jgi:hypothetical protein